MHIVMFRFHGEVTSQIVLDTNDQQDLRDTSGGDLKYESERQIGGDDNYSPVLSAAGGESACCEDANSGK